MASDSSGGPNESLAEAASTCDDCLCWVEHCHAECCHVFTFRLTPRSDVVYLDDVVRIHAPVTEDLRLYYELHGARVEDEIIIVPKSACEVTPTRLTVHMTCRELGDDYLCSVHEDGQPVCCRDFTAETALHDDWVLMPTCLYAYKAKRPEGQQGSSGEF
jgi:hypothetical protein